jgi:hypothetical protein
MNQQVAVCAPRHADHENDVILNEVKNLKALQRGIQRDVSLRST